MSISFFSPIHSDSYNPQEKCSFLRGAVRLFDFGQKAYLIRHYDGVEVNLIEVEGIKPTWLGITLRIIAMATLIIPLMALLGTCIYRALNTFQVVEMEPNRLNMLPPELLKTLYKQTGLFSCLQLKCTSKANKEFIEGDKTLNGYQTIIRTLEKCYRLTKDIENPFEKADALYRIAKTLIPIDHKKALEIANEATAPPDIGYLVTKANAMAEMAGMLSRIDQEKAKELADIALETAKAFPYTAEQSVAFALVAKAYASIDPNKAFEAIELARNAAMYIYATNAPKIIIEAVALLDQENLKTGVNKALEIIDPIHPYGKSKHLIAVAKIINSSDPEEALRITKTAIDTANTIEDEGTKCEALAKISRVLELFDSLNADEIADLMIASVNTLAPRFKSQILASIAKNLINREKALAIAETAFIEAMNIEYPNYKTKVYASIAVTLASWHPEHAEKAAKKALETAPDTMSAYDKAFFLNDIAKVMPFLDRSKALGLLEAMTPFANSINDKHYKPKALIALSTGLAAFDPQRAANIAMNQEPDFWELAGTIAVLEGKIAADVAQFGFDAAKNLQGRYRRIYADIIAKALAPKDLESALEGLNGIEDLHLKIKSTMKVIRVIKMDNIPNFKSDIFGSNQLP